MSEEEASAPPPVKRKKKKKRPAGDQARAGSPDAGSPDAGSGEPVSPWPYRIGQGLTLVGALWLMYTGWQRMAGEASLNFLPLIIVALGMVVMRRSDKPE